MFATQAKAKLNIDNIKVSNLVAIRHMSTVEVSKLSLYPQVIYKTFYF